jgi:hypothetical protein
MACVHRMTQIDPWTLIYTEGVHHAANYLLQFAAQWQHSELSKTGDIGWRGHMSHEADGSIRQTCFHSTIRA